MKKIRIIGGGAAGMSLAIGLSRAGFDVKIFEKRKRDCHNGLAFLLLQNGFETLCKMGLEHAILQKVHPLHTFKSVLSTGKKIKSEPMQYLFGAKRHDIVETIRNQVAPNIMVYEHEFSHFDYDENGCATTVHFTNGHSEKGDIFIGADGAHSKVRNSIFPNKKVCKTHVKEIVSLVHAPDLVRKLHGTFVKFTCKAGGRAAGLLPCTKEDIVWFFQFDERLINFNKEENDMRSFLMHQLGSWGPSIEEVLMKTDFSKSYLWNTHDMESLPSYHRNNVGLIGDAAHVFATFTSQGLNTALEDGYDLGKLMEKHSSTLTIEEIFTKFFHMRSETAEQHLQQGRNLKNQFLEIHSKTEEMMTPIAI